MPHRFHPSILREYDIRGVVGTTLSDADAEAVGQTFGTLVTRAGGRVVCVGRDGRLSSPALEAALVRGLASVGLEVRRIGCGPSPMLYFATRHLGADGGVMVTGSHNPPDHNGFKLVFGGKPFFGEQIRRLGRVAEAEEMAPALGGKAVEAEVGEAYLARLLQGFRPGRPLSVVWDCGNGATGPLVEALAARLPGRHRVLNGAVDGRFPAHHPDPADPETLGQLVAAVAETGADLGLAFDGDGDRLGVVAPGGRLFAGDQLLMLLAEEVLAENPGALVLADVKASQTLFDHVARLGGVAEMCRTGHSLIRSRMAESGALLAGDMSGHIFYGPPFDGVDDALYAALRLLGLVASWPSGELARRFDALPRLFATPELRLACPDERKAEVMTALKAALAARGEPRVEIDGVRVTTPDGWWLLRASNTQPALVARCESASAAGLERLKQRLSAELAQFGMDL